MRALLLATSILCATPALSYAACPGTPANCPSPTYNNLTANTMTLGTSGTPGTGWFQGLGISDALTHMATTTLEFPSFAAFAAYKPSVITTALAWAGAPVVAHTAGYYAIGDGGSATYVWNRSSSTTADGLYVITPGGSSGGRWFLQIPSGGTDVRALGVVVDGVTSADVKFVAAMTACGTYGTKLFIPPGFMKLDGTGGSGALLQNCALTGAGVPELLFTASVPGSVIALYSTSVSPFIIGPNFSITGLTFYWPNQTTGAATYPPLFTDVGAAQSGHGVINGIAIANAYDAFTQTNGLWGDIVITNSTMYAVHRLFTLNSTGDGLTMSNVRFSPGVWLGYGASHTAVGTAAQHCTIFEITAGGGVNLNLNNNLYLGCKYGFHIESGGSLGESVVDGTWDSVGTLVDTSAGGTWASGIVFTGQAASCSLSGPVWGVGSNVGNQPCFNLGSVGNTELSLLGFEGNGSQGDFVTTAGTDVAIVGGHSLNVGGNTLIDGLDYYQVHVTAGSPNIRVQNFKMGGINASTKTHGITTAGGVTPGSIQIQDNQFLFMNDDINVHTSNNFTTITGNTSAFTNAGGGLGSVNITGGGAVMYGSNDWDAPPVAAIVGGTGASASGMMIGRIFTGTGSVTSFTFQQPFVLLGGGATGCLFQDGNAVALGPSPDGSTPTKWTVTSAGSTNIASHFVYFNCEPQQ